MKSHGRSKSSSVLLLLTSWRHFVAWEPQTNSSKGRRIRSGGSDGWQTFAEAHPGQTSCCIDSLFTHAKVNDTNKERRYKLATGNQDRFWVHKVMSSQLVYGAYQYLPRARLNVKFSVVVCMYVPVYAISSSKSEYPRSCCKYFVNWK